LHLRRLDVGGATCQTASQLAMNTRHRSTTSRRLPSQLIQHLIPKRRELIQPVLDRPRDFVLFSARKLAEALGADAMAVLRTIRAMGFDGYADFREYLHELALAQATQLDAMQTALARDSDIPADLHASLARDIDNLAVVRNTLDFGRVEAVAARISTARRVVLLGGDVASVLVKFLQYNLSVIDLPAVACTLPGEVVHAVRPLGASDLVIALTFRRGLRQTVEGVQQARGLGAYCVAVTDTHLSPIARFANEYFVTPVDSTLVGVSYVAPMAWLNMLLVACAATRKTRTLQLLKSADVEQRTGFRWYTNGDLRSLQPRAKRRSAARAAGANNYRRSRRQ
jgi:RpiR family carbohydrate utilization transcriptional regulator